MTQKYTKRDSILMSTNIKQSSLSIAVCCFHMEVEKIVANRSLSPECFSLLCHLKSRENSPWRVTWRTFILLSSWIWFQTVGPRGLTRPCLVWHCGSLTCWPGLKSWRLGQLTLSYPRQCGWLDSSTLSHFSQQSCKPWLEGKGSTTFGRASTKKSS